MIKYHKLDLFDAPEDSVLVHAVNAEGVWGSGIALEFAKRHPKIEKSYKNYCALYKEKLVGQAVLTVDTNRRVFNLFTSSKISANRDSEEIILLNTILSVNDLLKQVDGRFDIYSNKFNSGVFGVPWEKTERIIEILSERYGVTWNVCDPSLS